jgi:hypothetical protein
MFKVPIDIIYINAFLFSIFPDVFENGPPNFLGEDGFAVFSGPYEMHPSLTRALARNKST